MRKHDVRKWLHAVLDLLPVILIPVFMIYCHRHTIDSGSIQVPQNEVVDFNQIVSFGNFTSSDEDNWLVSDGTLTFEDNTMTLVPNNTSSFARSRSSSPIRFNNNDILYLSFSVKSSSNMSDQYFEYTIQSNQYIFRDYLSLTTSWHRVSSISNSTGSDNVGYFFFYDRDGNLPSVSIKELEVINLTQMFGSGNEPTLTQFEQWYSEPYYDYTLSHKELLKGTSTITYDDTDIMSQVVYQLYNSVDKYFNMGNVFNMTGVYDWFNLNIFNGNAPISIYIVWNIVLYEFVMDLLFLLYGLFMWFIDMVEKLMEKPLKSVK